MPCSVGQAVSYRTPGHKQLNIARLHPTVAPLAPPIARRYMLWGLVGSQLGGCEVNMTGYGPDPVPVNLFLAEVFDIKLDFIWVSAWLEHQLVGCWYGFASVGVCDITLGLNLGERACR